MNANKNKAKNPEIVVTARKSRQKSITGNGWDIVIVFNVYNYYPDQFVRLPTSAPIATFTYRQKIACSNSIGASGLAKGALKGAVSTGGKRAAKQIYGIIGAILGEGAEPVGGGFAGYASGMALGAVGGAATSAYSQACGQ